MSRELTVRQKYVPATSSGINYTVVIVVAILAVAVLWYLTRNKPVAASIAQSAAPLNAKQWKITYTPDGMMSGIQMIELPKA